MVRWRMLTGARKLQVRGLRAPACDRQWPTAHPGSGAAAATGGCEMRRRPDELQQGATSDRVAAGYPPSQLGHGDTRFDGAQPARPAAAQGPAAAAATPRCQTAPEASSGPAAWARPAARLWPAGRCGVAETGSTRPCVRGCGGRRASALCRGFEPRRRPAVERRRTEDGGAEFSARQQDSRSRQASRRHRDSRRRRVRRHETARAASSRGGGSERRCNTCGFAQTVCGGVLKLA